MSCKLYIVHSDILYGIKFIIALLLLCFIDQFCYVELFSVKQDS